MKQDPSPKPPLGESVRIAGLAEGFKQSASQALKDTQLQRALANVKRGFIVKRAAACAKLPEFDRICEEARAIKEHTLAHLDLYLERFERRVIESGGVVHWARNGAEARDIVLKVCRDSGARLVTKGKSMVAEEIGLDRHLEAAGLEVVETDLGEYILQIRGDRPSHIIAPVIHLNQEQIAQDFQRAHAQFPKDRPLDTAADLVAEARAVLRAKFLAADVGITGANLLVAETGSSVIVTNEGNGDLTQTLPRVHIVVASIEKVVPTLEDACTILRVLARSATGQDITSYTSFATGPRCKRDPDGPEAYHVILLDNGRSEMLGSAFHDMLRCIRCGACMNHCPIYGAIGGHAYGSVYPGPMGAVLTPFFAGIEHAYDLPNASTFCGRCEEVCPMGIPLPSLMRLWRRRSFERGSAGLAERLALSLWAFAAKRPRLYHALAGIAVPLLGLAGQRRGVLKHLPFAQVWTQSRDLPAPQGPTFRQMWRKYRQRREP